jgi:hypothetical protein
MFGQVPASPSIPEPRSNIAAQFEPASRGFADPAELAATLDTSSGIFSDVETEPLLPALVEASTPVRTARAVPVGTLLYLTSVGIIAVATIGVFFGIGFFLLAQSTAAIIASDASRQQAPATDSGPRFPLGKASQTSSDAASPPIQPEILRSAATAPLPAASLMQPAQLPTPIGSATTGPSPDHSAVETSLGSSASEPSQPASAVPTPTAEEPQGSSADPPAVRKPLGAPVAASAPAMAPSLSAGQIAELLTRGDTFLHAGDVASARLFYERAADAGDREAAMRMGATFDPAFLGRVGLHARADPAIALSWYRHALDLAAPKTDRQVESPQTK